MQYTIEARELTSKYTQRPAYDFQSRQMTGEASGADEAITRYVRELRPQVVLCPDPAGVFFGDRDFNQHDHPASGLGALAA